MWIVFLAVIPVYLIVGIGPLLRRSGLLKQEADASIMGVAVHVLLPALILHSMLGNPMMTDVKVVCSSMAVGFGLVCIATFIAYFCGGFFGLKNGGGRRTFGVTTGIQNYGYLAIPMVASLFPKDGAMAVLFVHNMGVEIAMWTISLMLLSGDFKISARLFLKGPIVAVVVGLLINFTGLATSLPQPVMKTLEMLGMCALPVALLLIGTTLYDLLGKEKFKLGICIGACFLRLLLFPATILATAYFLPLSLPLKQVLCVQAALPAAMFPIIMAKHYGGQVGVAVQVVLSSTILSVVTMPLIIYLGMKLMDFTT